MARQRIAYTRTFQFNIYVWDIIHIWDVWRKQIAHKHIRWEDAEGMKGDGILALDFTMIPYACAEVMAQSRTSKHFSRIFWFNGAGFPHFIYAFHYLLTYTYIYIKWNSKYSKNVIKLFSFVLYILILYFYTKSDIYRKLISIFNMQSVYFWRRKEIIIFFKIFNSSKKFAS